MLRLLFSNEGELGVKGIGAWAVVALTVLVVGMTGCGGTGGDGTTGPVPASPAGKAEAANFNGVDAGEVEVVLQVKDLQKKQPEAVKMRILGTFTEAGEKPLPQVDVAIESHGDLAGHQIEFLSGPLLRDDKWVVNFAGKVYEPSQATFEELRSKFEEAEGEAGGPGNAMACVEAGEGFSPTDVLENISYEGKSETTTGESVETVGADLKVPAAIDEVIALTKNSAGCKEQLEAIGLPSASELKALEKKLEVTLVEAPRITLSIDKKGVVRYFRIVANVEKPHGGELEAELYLRLERVNEPTSMPITHGYNPYPALLKQFGLNNEDVEQADGGEIWVGILGVLADRMFGREGG